MVFEASIRPSPYDDVLKNHAFIAPGAAGPTAGIFQTLESL
jgi:hypothetical protein